MADDGLRYTIEARALGIGPAAHDFWVLRAPDGHVIAEMHGLATERDGPPHQILPIGLDEEKHSLRAWQFLRDDSYQQDIVNFAKNGELLSDAEMRGYGLKADRPAHSSYVQDGQASREVFSGTQQEVLARWNAAAKMIPQINAQDLDYPSIGVNILSPTINSNSAYRTFGELMGLPVHEFSQYVQPGIGERMLPEAEISANRVPGLHVFTAFSGSEQTAGIQPQFGDPHSPVEIEAQQRQTEIKQTQDADERARWEQQSAGQAQSQPVEHGRDQLTDKQRAAFDQLGVFLNPKLAQMGYSPDECDNIKAGCLQAMQKMGVSEVKFAGITPEGRVVIGSEVKYHTPSCLAETYSQTPAEQTLNTLSQQQELSTRQQAQQHEHAGPSR